MIMLLCLAAALQHPQALRRGQRKAVSANPLNPMRRQEFRDHLKIAFPENFPCGFRAAPSA
jgi:hypothetical protein